MRKKSGRLPTNCALRDMACHPLSLMQTPKCFSKPTFAIHLSTEPMQQKQPITFPVGATVHGALQSNGARGNVFKFLERHRGFFSKEVGIQIMHKGEDLTVKVHFKEEGDACNF